MHEFLSKFSFFELGFFAFLIALIIALVTGVFTDNDDDDSYYDQGDDD